MVSRKIHCNAFLIPCKRSFDRTYYSTVHKYLHVLRPIVPTMENHLINIPCSFKLHAGQFLLIHIKPDRCILHILNICKYLLRVFLCGHSKRMQPICHHGLDIFLINLPKPVHILPCHQNRISLALPDISIHFKLPCI